jgi:hypothetical protein
MYTSSLVAYVIQVSMSTYTLSESMFIEV